MKTDYLEITSDGVTVKATLRAATNGDNMRRALLKSQALSNPLPDIGDQITAQQIWPCCMASVVEGTITEGENTRDIKELTNTDFVNLPTEIGEAWMTMVVKLTPSWDIVPAADTASAEKKD
jgi:hypothetical protein